LVFGNQLRAAREEGGRKKGKRTGKGREEEEERTDRDNKGRQRKGNQSGAVVLECFAIGLLWGA
jgi:hypothetical protein